MKKVEAVMVSGMVEPFWEPGISQKELEKRRNKFKREQNKQFRKENEFKVIEGLEVYRYKEREWGGTRIWKHKKSGRIFCECLNGKFEIYLEEYGFLYKCTKCGRKDEVNY